MSLKIKTVKGIYTKIVVEEIIYQEHVSHAGVQKMGGDTQNHGGATHASVYV